MKKLYAALLVLVLFAATAMPTLACRHYGTRSHYRPARYSRVSTRSYYNYPGQRTFWQKHRDKLTLAIGTGGGALIGGLIGGRKGAGIGALSGLGGSALYTYKLRNRNPRY